MSNFNSESNPKNRDPLAITNMKFESLTSSFVYDPLYNSVGVFRYGINDVVQGANGRSISRWHDLILRAYSPKNTLKTTTYAGTTVDDSFKRLSSYLKWEANEMNRILTSISTLKSQGKLIDPRVLELAVDKDLTAPIFENGVCINPLVSLATEKVYSDKCILLPKVVNSFFIRNAGVIPGVKIKKGVKNQKVFRSHNKKETSRFLSIEECHRHYQLTKIKQIDDLIAWNVDPNVLYRLYEVKAIVEADIAANRLTTFWQRTNLK